MFAFDKDQIHHLERLARIGITPEEKEELVSHLKRILDYVELLKEVDTEHVKPALHVAEGMIKNVFREDEVKDLLPREDFLKNAPDHIGGMIRTPPILKE